MEEGIGRRRYKPLRAGTSRYAPVQAGTSGGVTEDRSGGVGAARRSLFAANDPRGIDRALTVVDDRSDDEGLGRRGRTSPKPASPSPRGVAFAQTGFDAGVASEKHGAALNGFVRDYRDGPRSLFLDSDSRFAETDAIPTMLAELAASPPSVFANQEPGAGPRALRCPRHRGAGRRPRCRPRRRPAAVDADRGRHRLSGHGRPAPPPRLLPGRQHAARPGRRRDGRAGPGGGPQPGTAVFHDTFALMTRVMASHGHRFVVSSKTAGHFAETVAGPEGRGTKDRDRRRRLGASRGDRSSSVAPG